MRYLVSVFAFLFAIAWLGNSQIFFTWEAAPLLHFVSWALFLGFSLLSTFAATEWDKLVALFFGAQR